MTPLTTQHLRAEMEKLTAERDKWQIHVNNLNAKLADFEEAVRILEEEK